MSDSDDFDDDFFNNIFDELELNDSIFEDDLEQNTKLIATKEFIVNGYITLRLENDQPNIYVDGKLFQIKEMIDDLNNIFNISLKIRRRNKHGKYKWNLKLIFKWNYKNFYKINNNLLKRKLGEILNIVENGNYGEEIFDLKNPSCSQFYIKGDSSNHLKDSDMLYKFPNSFKLIAK